MITARTARRLAMLVAGLAAGSVAMVVAAQQPKQPEPTHPPADTSRHAQGQTAKTDQPPAKTEAEKREEAERRDARKARDAASRTGDAREEEEEDDPR